MSVLGLVPDHWMFDAAFALSIPVTHHRLERAGCRERRSGVLNRRDLLRSLAGVGALSVAYPLAGCGDAVGRRTAELPRGRASFVAATDVSRGRGGAAERPDAVRAVQSITVDLYRGLADGPGNLVCSPYSVAVALAMTRNGASGRTATEMDRVLSSPRARLDAGLNSLTQLIDSRAGRQRRADGSRATVALDVASSLWGQRGTRWEPGFLRALARYFGTGMRIVDYRVHSEAPRTLINQWTATTTHERITDIIPAGILDQLTRLVLVNAIYLKAPWEEPFDPARTLRRPFVRADGSRVQTEMMRGTLESASFASGPGWQAAQLAYAGRRLAMTIVVPHQSNLAELEQSMTMPRLTQVLTSMRPVPTLELRMPRWKFRRASQLNNILARLGMPSAFDPTRADFSAMTTDEQLYISAVLHQAFIAVDEKGTEAAAATAVVMRAGSASTIPPVVLNADHAFMFVINDIETATPLFIGRVDDPTAST
jgi:serpin B